MADFQNSSSALSVASSANSLSTYINGLPAFVETDNLADCPVFVDDSLVDEDDEYPRPLSVYFFYPKYKPEVIEPPKDAIIFKPQSSGELKEDCSIMTCDDSELSKLQYNNPCKCSIPICVSCVINIRKDHMLKGRHHIKYDKCPQCSRVCYWTTYLCKEDEVEPIIRNPRYIRFEVQDILNYYKEKKFLYNMSKNNDHYRAIMMKDDGDHTLADECYLELISYIADELDEDVNVVAGDMFFCDFDSAHTIEPMNWELYNFGDDFEMKDKNFSFVYRNENTKRYSKWSVYYDDDSRLRDILNDRIDDQPTQVPIHIIIDHLLTEEHHSAFGVSSQLIANNETFNSIIENQEDELLSLMICEDREDAINQWINEMDIEDIKYEFGWDDIAEISSCDGNMYYRTISHCDTIL
jgi:hypothetical protein